jgi:hypothetical protein
MQSTFGRRCLRFETLEPRCLLTTFVPGPDLNASHTTTAELYFGIGQAWGDYDRDGWLDLYVTDSQGPNTLYRNQGDGTLAISPLSAQVALPAAPSGGVVFGDYNNDGWTDLYVANRGDNVLFRNDGGIGFTDVTAKAGVADGGSGESASWGDYDQDGFLDLYVTNWSCNDCDVHHSDALFHNNGDGSFVSITDQLPEKARSAIGFAASWVDYDNDSDLDLYVINDRLAGNLLMRNDGPAAGPHGWRFTDVSSETNTQSEVYGMGLAVGDYDGDLDLDFYFSNIGPAVLLANGSSQGSLAFTDHSAAAGVAYDATHWAASFLDYDNDGALDLYLAVMLPTNLARNRLYHNLGDGTFEDVSAGSGADDGSTTVGLAYADYNRDGRLDLVVGNHNDAYQLYRNDSDTAANRNWVSVQLTGAGDVNRDAVGARVYLELTDGRTLMQEVKNGSSKGAGNQLALHFGLGDATVNAATIRWPNGTSERHANTSIDRFWERTYDPDDFLFADADHFRLLRQSPLTVPGRRSVLNNDDATAVSAELVSQPTHGSVSLNADGSFVYTPASNFIGFDSFVYQARDAFGRMSNAAYVVIEVGRPLTFIGASDARPNFVKPTGNRTPTFVDEESGSAHEPERLVRFQRSRQAQAGSRVVAIRVADLAGQQRAVEGLQEAMRRIGSELETKRR